jgi:leucyl/phenylalanyl-tRNA--protein transferase
MCEAYGELHRRGIAHSVETWRDGQLVGGLYGVQLGAVFFGESMFSRQSDASKVALSALVRAALVGGTQLIDCQMRTRHLSSLGSRALRRGDFIAAVARGTRDVPDRWRAP